MEFLYITTSLSIISIIFFILPNNTQYIINSFSSLSIICILSIASLSYLNTNHSNNLINFIINNNSIENTQIFSINITIDYLSALLTLLSIILLASCLLLSNTTIYHANNNLLLLLYIITLILIITFSTTHMLLFYILFESSIIPLIIIIGLWGSRNENIRATYYFLLYTVIGSLPLFLTILTIYNKANSFNFTLIQNSENLEIEQFLQFIGLFIAFAINTPLIPWHSWLPLAHVEAPAIGSVLLAGILLNLGAYGFIRFTIPFLPNTSNFFTPLIITISILSLWLSSLNSLRQNDINRIIAYSSIAHMGIITAAIFSNNYISNNGAITLMISHGLTSPALFILTSLLYERHNTRLINNLTGTSQLTPSLTTLLFLTSLAHMSTPGSINFIGEYTCLLGLWELHPLTSLLSIIGVLLTTTYLLLLYIQISSSNPLIYTNYNLYDINNNEIFSIYILIIPNIVLGIAPSPLI